MHIKLFVWLSALDRHGSYYAHNISSFSCFWKLVFSVIWDILSPLVAVNTKPVYNIRNLLCIKCYQPKALRTERAIMTTRQREMNNIRIQQVCEPNNSYFRRACFLCVQVFWVPLFSARHYLNCATCHIRVLDNFPFNIFLLHSVLYDASS
jgi:hypothetical protein